MNKYNLERSGEKFDKAINKALSLYPIGSIYTTSSDSVTASTLHDTFGGTWVEDFPPSGTQHYAFYKWNTFTLDSNNTNVSKSITLITSGNPVYLEICGDNNPTSSGWLNITISKGSTVLTRQYCESVLNSHNVPFSLSYLDTPAAGTNVYTFKIEIGGGTVTCGEDGNIQAPQLIAFEVNSKCDGVYHWRRTE